jgi:predicted anti-sigma-YlaC factor YlaD
MNCGKTLRVLNNGRGLGGWIPGVGLALGLVFLNSGCSIKKMAVNKVGDALASGGTVFSSDEDPELVKAAVPFSLKLMESLLAESPKHKGLLFATSSGFTQYAFAFVQQEADEMEAENVAKAMEMRARAQKLYLRAKEYGMRGLEATYPGIGQALRADPKKGVRLAKSKKDAGPLYWTAASWAAATSVIKNDANLIADLPIIEALIDRALELDESYGEGAIHSFLITYEMGRRGVQGDPAERSKAHFERAIALSEGKSAGAYVSYAEAVPLAKQNKTDFQALLNKALAINPNDKPDSRLANLVMQRRARWLLGRLDELFVSVPGGRGRHVALKD